MLKTSAASKALLVELVLILCLAGDAIAQYSGLLINEFLPRPKNSSGVFLDTNNDSVTNVFDDEFVELLNTSTNSIDVEGLWLTDANAGIKRHVFSHRILPSGGSIVVFGGGSILNFSNPPAQIATAVSLSLNDNGPETISLFSPQTTLVDQVSYDFTSTHDAISSTREPDGIGDFTNHLQASAGASRASPGRRVHGQHFLTNQPPVLLDLGNQTAFVGLNMSFPVRAYDPADRDSITLTLAGLPPNATFSSTGGVGTFNFTPDATQTGQVYNLSFAATDNDGAETNSIVIAVISPISSEDVWINEFHYDNAGGDVDEGIEIAGTAGIVLTNYSLVLYNGGDSKTYDTKLLSGTVDNEQCGLGAVWFAYPANGIQNDTEAIALVRGTNVVQFLSYEGTLTASNGPALGMTSTDIVVDESTPPAAGYSLQLRGTGTQYSSFFWTAASPSTHDNLNSGQVVTCFSPASITLEKTVYLGHNGGAGFPGAEVVQNTNGTAITYLFLVQNTGGSTLTNVTVTDATLGISPIVLGTMTAGASRTAYVESVVSGDLRNTATASGYDSNDALLQDSDSAEVVEIIPLIEVQKTVYRGHDGGASCPGVEFVQDTNDAPVTYCFRVANNGNTNLTSVTLSDPALGLTNVLLGTMVPGQVIFTSLESTVTASLTNTANVTGTDPNSNPVSDDDTATVELIQPALALQKTVYAGHDGGASCPGSELVIDTNGTPVTFCFTLVNAGDVAITNIIVYDPFLSPPTLATIPVLAVGQTSSFYRESTISASFVNTSVVTGYGPNGIVVEAFDTAEIVKISTDQSCGTYEIIDVGTLGGTSSRAYGINDKGQVVGQAALATGEDRAFLWQDGVITSLLSLSNISSSAAYEINERADATGYVVSNGNYKGFYWATGSLTIVMSSPSIFATTIAAINSSNEFVGHLVSTTNSSHPHPFYMKDGTIVDLGTFSGVISGGAFDINDLGMVVGYAHIFCGPEFPCNTDCWDPFIWVDANTNGYRDAGEFMNLGSLGGCAGWAQGINNIGQVVGHTQTTGYTTPHAYLLTPQGGLWDFDSNNNSRSNVFMQDLGTLGGSSSEARAINDAGDVVGYALASNSQSRAFLYSAGKMFDLNSMICPGAGWQLQEADDINNSGQIVGWGVVSGFTRGFLLNPNTNLVEMVRLRSDALVEEGKALVVWRGMGAGLHYTLQSTTNMQKPVWTSVPPTNQWPSTYPYWIGDVTGGVDQSFFRVIGK